MAFLYHLFPPTIHPMVVHFTIALPYLASFFGLLGLFFRKRDFFAKVFFILLFLSILATIFAGIAGVISESYVHVRHPVAGLLENHKNYGEITGVFLVAAFVSQWFLQRKAKKVSTVALIFCILAMITVSVAGYIGGSMVYDYGFGVHVLQSTGAK